MNTIERVKQYQKELSEFKETKFSLKAFFFGPVYFLYYDLAVEGVAFFFLPLVIFLPLTLLGFGWEAFWPILFLCEVVAGFYAPSKIRSAKQAYIERFKNADPDADIAYFSVSPARLVLLSWLSGGLYKIYWEYKNWCFIRSNTKEDITPVCRSWLFGIFFIYPLFLRIRKSAEKYAKVSSGLMWYGLSYLVLWIFQLLIQRGINSGMNGIWFFIGCLVISPLLLLPYQKQINEYNQFIKPSEPQQKKLYFGEVLTVIIGMLLSVWGAGITYSENKVANALNNFNDDKQMVIGYLGGSYLRHTEGYGEVCANLGTPLQKYPQRFKDVYRREYQDLADVLSAQGLSMEEFMNEMKQSLKDILPSGAENKLSQIRQQLIISVMAEKDKVTPEDVEWKDEYAEILPLNRVCEFLDNDPEFVFWEKDEIEQAVKQLKK